LPRQAARVEARWCGPGQFLREKVGQRLLPATVSEYVRDLIRRDKERSEAQAFERLKAELTLAFAAPDSSFHPMTAADIVARNPSAAQN